MNFLRFLSEKLNLLACPACKTGDGSGINDLCSDCRKKLLFFSDSCCKLCGGELDNVFDYCSKCIHEAQRPFAEGASVFAYQSFAREIITEYKSGKMSVYGRIFGRMAAERLRRNYTHWDFDIIVPVPLHWTRKFKRKFNQSQLIAEFISAELKVPCRPEALRRIKKAKAQKFLSAAERRMNLKNAFRGSRKIVQDMKILLIDDVFTTGATLSCAADELLNCGAKCVYVMSIARA